MLHWNNIDNMLPIFNSNLSYLFSYLFIYILPIAAE